MRNSRHSSIFDHGNVQLPGAPDRALRWLVETPAVHRVHHSVVARETNSKFSFDLAGRDHPFGTYRDQPAAGHHGMTIGIGQFREPRELRLDRMLLQPLRGGDPDSRLGRREPGG